MEQFQYIYFLGIGGIGMSALARWFRQEGYWVGGYDRTATDLTQALQAEGILAGFEDSIDALPQEVIQHQAQTLVIWTPAIPSDSPQLNYFKERGYALHKRAEVLGWLTRDFFTIAVAGTHGKTTTSSMVAHILQQSPRSCTAFLGGILQNYGSNMLLSKHKGAQQIMVVEADEYDRSFLHLSPNVLIITSLDADHLDIYGSKEEMIATYQLLVGKMEEGDTLILRKGLEEVLDTSKIRAKILTYGQAGEASDFQISPTEVRDSLSTARISAQEAGKFETVLRLRLHGKYNMENATAAMLACRSLVEGEHIQAALASFLGAERRFQYWLDTKNRVLIDDYAHHPTEVLAFLTAVRELYPTRHITAIFQPHLYSRTRDFVEEFSQSFSQIDELCLLDIYPARELPIEGVSSEWLLGKISFEGHLKAKYTMLKQNLLSFLSERDNLDIVLTVGAGDVNTFLPAIKELLSKE